MAAAEIDVKDTALLHIAALLDPEVKNARLIGWAHVFTFNDILRTLRKLRPNRQFLPDFANETQLTMTADTEQARALLKKWGNQADWKSLESTVADSLLRFVEQ